jgi:xanthine dehydrogenase iron-sulfur cluster and FAD-binding subunit A
VLAFGGFRVHCVFVAWNGLTGENQMATRMGKTINGKHFTQCWTTRAGRATLICHIDGKITPMAKWKIARDEALKAEGAA